MQRRSYRATHADRVLKFLMRQNRPLSAYEMLEDLRGEGITAATTVYRALDKLLAEGQVHRIESLNAWIVCCGSHHEAIPVFEICDGCGNVTEHLDPSLTGSLADLSKRTGFAPDHSVIEIHGRCSDCNSDASTS